MPSVGFEERLTGAARRVRGFNDESRPGPVGPAGRLAVRWGGGLEGPVVVRRSGRRRPGVGGRAGVLLEALVPAGIAATDSAAGVRGLERVACARAPLGLVGSV